MAATPTVSCFCSFSSLPTSKFRAQNKLPTIPGQIRFPTSFLRRHNNVNAGSRRCVTRSSSQNDHRQSQLNSEQKGRSFSFKECAISIALAAGLVLGVPAIDSSANAYATSPVLPDVSVLISGPPIKDPGALLRYALPIDNKAIREVQKPLEDITDSLKVSGSKALDSVGRNARQASRALKQGKTLIVSGLAESKKDHGVELLDKLEVGLEELQQITEDRRRDAIVPKQKELLQYVGG